MRSPRVLKLFRFLERFVLLILIVGLIGVTELRRVDSLTREELIFGAGILGLLLVVLVFLGRMVDAWVATAIAQSSFTNQDAFDSLYAASPVAYVTIDVRGLIVDFNPATVHLLDTERPVLKGKNLFKLMGETDDFDPSVLRGKVAAGLTINDLEVPLKTFADKTVWVLMSVYTSYNKNERLIAMVDMTEKKQIDTAKSEFVALATHQLRTPIAAIRWNMELLGKNLGDATNEKQANYMGKINRNVYRMIDLINDFLSVSKLEMGTFAAEAETIDLTEFMDSIVDEFDGKIAEKQLTINRNEQPPHLTYTADRRLFHIIVSNLVSNAVKYVERGGTIDVSYQQTGDQLKLVIADDGMGIPAGEVDNLFTKFFRASNAQAQMTQGTGLGLYIVKKSVEQLGGEIKVSSEEGQGTRFTIRLPGGMIS